MNNEIMKANQNSVKVFENEEFGSVRTVEINGEPWFVGKDVAKALGYEKPLNALSAHVDEDDSLKRGVIDSMGRMQETIIINESGLYALVLSSKLESAKRFKRWVTSEVLPSIRKHGGYVAGQESMDATEYFARAVLMADKVIREKDAKIAELAPKAGYCDLVLQCKDLLTITEIAKDYGLTARAFNKLLADLKVQYKQSGRWFLYAAHASNGYASSETATYHKANGEIGTNTILKWTQAGRLFLYHTLKSKGVLPVTESVAA